MRAIGLRRGKKAPVAKERDTGGVAFLMGGKDCGVRKFIENWAFELRIGGMIEAPLQVFILQIPCKLSAFHFWRIIGELNYTSNG